MQGADKPQQDPMQQLALSAFRNLSTAANAASMQEHSGTAIQHNICRPVLFCIAGMLHCGVHLASGLCWT